MHIDARENGNDTPSHADIACEAYAIYLADGAHDGHALDHWLEAERRLKLRHRLFPLQSIAAVQHVNGEHRQRLTRPIPDRRRTPRPVFPGHWPAPAIY